MVFDKLVQSSLESEHRLEWIPCTITDIEPSQTDNVYYAIRNVTHDDSDRVDKKKIMLVLLGSIEACTPTFVREFARIYSLPTHEYDNDVSQFRRYSKWLKRRNDLIEGFTKHEDSYYMVADRFFYHYFYRYGFCSACGIFRCSPVWCICGHKQLCDGDGWTGRDKQLDEFIKKSQSQTNSPNDAYLEWIPFDCIDDWENGSGYLYGLPIPYWIRLIPIDDLLCNESSDEDAIGFTYNAIKQKYYLIKCKDELCLACTNPFKPIISTFCYECKAPRPLNWTTGNESLDSFIMESWHNVIYTNDDYIQWIEYHLLMNIREMTSLRHGCTLIAEWLEPTKDKLIRVTLKQISDTQSLDFRQLIKKYPTILTPENIWIIGITREPSTQKYYLVFYHEIRSILDKILPYYGNIPYISYGHFYELEEIGSGSYKTIYTAKHKYDSATIVLKRFKNFDQTQQLFINELRNHAMCVRNTNPQSFLHIDGVTQDPETKDYMIVMQYAGNGSLLSYLDRNINKLTWENRLWLLARIAHNLYQIHSKDLVHCDLHGGSIVLHRNTIDNAYICDLSLSRSVNSHQSTIQGALPFIAPEVFHTRKFTQKSDIYSFGIIMYLMATGEPPFGGREFDRDLLSDVIGGLRPTMPDSAPEEYKKLAEQCCDADPDKHPIAFRLWADIPHLTTKESIRRIDEAQNGREPAQKKRKGNRDMTV